MMIEATKIKPTRAELKRISREADRALKNQSTWAVYVKGDRRLSKSYRAVFRSGVQFFDIGYECTGDEGGKKKAQWFVKMFLQGLRNIGVDTRTRKRK